MNSPLPTPIVEELRPVPEIIQAVRSMSSLPHLLLLDSALRREHVGRYSFLMADPIKTFEINTAEHGTDPFIQLNASIEPIQTNVLDGLPPFQGGIAGQMSYELGRCFERIPSSPIDEFQIPVLSAGLYDWVIAWDHEAQRAWIISNGWSEASSAPQEACAQQRLDFVKGLLHNGPPSVKAPQTKTFHVSSRLHPSVLSSTQFCLPEFLQISSNFSRNDYLEAVDRVIEYIRAGDIFQANLTQRLMCVSDVNPVQLFERLRCVNPAPFSGLMLWNDWAIISASPERFLRVENREVETRPIKGTRKRKKGPEADLFTRDELRESEKDQAENVMIVDLLRNDLSRVCKQGSVKVPQLCAVETYETVQHLVSEIRATLRDEVSVWDLYKATFPGGSITGAPKVRAMEIIAEIEPTVRGPYCGSLFYVGANGQSDSNLLIRSFVQRHGCLQLGVGGGIVAQSDPESEYEETLAKAAGMIKALS